MTMPFGYVSPEQLMKDRADYARKGIARGRSVVVLGYDKGIAFVAENPSQALHKVSEIYDRTDVTARGLANAYAQTLGTVFTQESKPYEVEIVVAEVGSSADEDQIYRLTYDGSVADELGFVAMGGAAETIETGLKDRWSPGLTLGDALSLAVGLLGQDPADPTGGAKRTLSAAQLEVAVLDRERPRRTFRRIGGGLLDALLSTEDPTSDAPSEDDPTPGRHDTLTGEGSPRDDTTNPQTQRPEEG